MDTAPIDLSHINELTVTLNDLDKPDMIYAYLTDREERCPTDIWVCAPTCFNICCVSVMVDGVAKFYFVSSID